MKVFFLLTLSLFSANFIVAQENNINNVFKGTRFVNNQSANLAEKGELLLQIQHRFGDISGGLYELFGLDQASMRLGFEYGFDNFNLGIGRSTFMKTYDAFGKLRISRQHSDFPFTIVLSAGGSVPTLKDFYPENKDNFSNKFSANTQLHIAKTFNNFGFQLSPGFMKTGFLPAENKSINLVTLGLGASVQLSKKITANIEYLHNFNNELSNNKPLSAGVDIDTGGHLFQLVLSNAQGMFDQMLVTQTMGDWTAGKVFFGFNLIREFDINKNIVF